MQIMRKNIYLYILINKSTYLTERKRKDNCQEKKIHDIIIYLSRLIANSIPKAGQHNSYIS